MSIFAYVDSYIAKMKSMLLRGVVQRVNESTLMRELQLKILADDDDDGVEHYDPFGFSARPVEPNAAGAAEAIVAALGADPSHNVVLVVADRRFRPTDLEEGEVVLYDDGGAYVKLSKSVFTDLAGQKGVAIKGGDFVAIGDGEAPASSYLACARATDSVRSTIAEDTAFWTWVNAVALATSTTPPTKLDAVITDGSSKVVIA